MFLAFQLLRASLLSETRRVSVGPGEVRSQTSESMTLLLRADQASCETSMARERINYARVTRISLERVALYCHEHDIIVN